MGFIAVLLVIIVFYVILLKIGEHEKKIKKQQDQMISQAVRELDYLKKNSAYYKAHPEKYKAQKEHKDVHKCKSPKPHNNKCPFCGSTLINCTGRYGAYLRCKHCGYTYW